MESHLFLGLFGVSGQRFPGEQQQRGGLPASQQAALKQRCNMGCKGCVGLWMGLLEFWDQWEQSLRVRGWDAVQGPCGYPAYAGGGEVGHTLLPGQNSSVPHTKVQCVLPGDLDLAQTLTTTGLLRGYHRSVLWPLHSRLPAGIGPIGPDGQPPRFLPRSSCNYKDAIVSFLSEIPVKITPLPSYDWLSAVTPCLGAPPSYACPSWQWARVTV